MLERLAGVSRVLRKGIFTISDTANRLHDVSGARSAIIPLFTTAQTLRLAARYNGMMVAELRPEGSKRKAEKSPGAAIRDQAQPEAVPRLRDGEPTRARTASHENGPGGTSDGALARVSAHEGGSTGKSVQQG